MFEGTYHKAIFKAKDDYYLCKLRTYIILPSKIEGLSRQEYILLVIKLA